MKKTLLTIATLAAVSIVLTAGASARTQPTRRYAVCTVETCLATGYHRHSGVTYGPHHADDGHPYCANGYYDDSRPYSGYGRGGCCGGYRR